MTQYNKINSIIEDRENSKNESILKNVMNEIFITVLCIFSSHCYGHNNLIIDTVPLIEYVNVQDITQQPAFYINGKFSTLRTIDPAYIDNVRVENKKVEIENKKYDGQIFITMKKGYSPLEISLNGLARKYTNLKNEPTIFMIDSIIVKEDYDKYLVDEKYIFKIIVETIQQNNVTIVQLLTKSKENIEKSKEVRIRGLKDVAYNFLNQ